MRPRLPAILCMLGLAACPEFVPVDDAGRPSTSDMKCSLQPDMAALLPSCPAAKGLVGDNLLCVDFANTQTTIADLTAKGWDFTSAMLNCPGWQIMSNVLEVQNFTNFSNGSCGLRLPPITTGQIQKYSRLTLSIQQRVDLNDPEQQAQIYLDSDTSSTRLMWTATGKKDLPRQQTTITIDTADLSPTLKTNGFKWLLKIASMIQVGRKGWQIESIAVNASP